MGEAVRDVGGGPGVREDGGVDQPPFICRWKAIAIVAALAVPAHALSRGRAGPGGRLVCRHLKEPDNLRVLP